MTDPSETHHFTADTASAGQRLDRFLAARLPPGLSRTRVQALASDGHVEVNGSPAKPRHALRPGDEITVRVPPDRPPETLPENLPLRILHRDPRLAVIDKESGIVVHPAAGNESGTLVNALLHHFGSLSSVGGVARPGIVHRLDKDTSGLMVVALDDETHHALTASFAARQVAKLYLAVASGILATDHGEIRTAIARHPGNRKKMAVVPEDKGKAAATDYTVLARSADTGPRGASLAVCRLHTGRTHQIRVHLHHLGHPLLGDEIYSGPAIQEAAPRLMLHAWHLAFHHPADGTLLSFTSPPPAAFDPWRPDTGWPDPAIFI